MPEARRGPSSGFRGRVRGGAGGGLLLAALLGVGSGRLGRGAAVLEAGVETLVEGLQFAEGPVWVPEGGDPSLPPETLLFSDIPANTIYAWSENRGLEVFAGDSGESNGNLLDAEGRLVSCRHGGRDLVVWSRNVTFDSEPTATVLASRYDGKRLNSPNDAALHPVDRSIYFTDPSWGLINKPVESQELPCHGVFRLDPVTGNVSVVLDNLAMPNGIAFSPEGDILYVSDTGARPDHANPAFASAKPPSTIRAWAFANGAVASPDSPLWTVQDFSDGMCFVAGDGLWTTRGGGAEDALGKKGLVLRDPMTGAEKGLVPLDEPPTNVVCDAPGGQGLLVTAESRVFRVTLPG